MSSTPQPMSISVETFRAAMGQVASGVTIVTTHAAGEDHGFTASSFTSLSLSPMLVLVCVDKAQRSHALIEQSGNYAVNILSSDQAVLGARFARPEPPNRFDGIAVSRGLTGSPLLAGNLAWVDCRLKDIFPGGDHSIFVGEVLTGEVSAGAGALLYFNRRWGTFNAT